MATGWTVTAFAPDAAPAAPMSELRNGRMRVPSPVVPSEHHDVALAHPAGDGRRRPAGLDPAGAVDEDRPLQAGERAEDRPAGDLGLGDEGDGQDAAEGGDVEPRDMVRRDEERRLRRRADHRDAEADHAAGDPLPDPWQRRGEAPVAPRRENLQGHEEEGQRSEHADEDGEAERLHQPSSCSRPRPAGDSGTP
ncbi:MAG TPA: hypothetical protein PKA74_13770 [Bauldia sp.]|nr:hypothetical protein [Bauldia sp.]